MSRAYDQIRQVLDQQQPEGWRYNRVLAGVLMPIVRDAIARAFDAAADILDQPDERALVVEDPAHPARQLRQWASDARSLDGSVEG